VIPKTLATY